MLLAVCAVLELGAASAANATTSVVMTMDPSLDPGPGETITIAVRVTANAGETDNFVFGAIAYPGSYVTPVFGSAVQFALPSTAAGPWSLGVLPACTTAFCRAFNQSNFPGGAVNVTTSPSRRCNSPSW